ncbi:MAG: hypothetical protein ACRC8A_14335 [Microcoleaceae cyanobacterium]
MLSQPTFDDRALSESFYKAFVRHFHNSLSLPLQLLVSECSFGIAPSPTGTKTFFIIAPALEVAEQLLQEVVSLSQPIQALTGGVRQLAICIVPIQDSKMSLNLGSCLNNWTFPPSNLICKLVDLEVESDECVD